MLLAGLIAQAGEVALDPSFGAGGVVLPSFPSLPSIEASGEGRCVAVQADGKMVVAGHSLAGGRRILAVLRVLPDGTLDPAFGASGVALPFPSAADDQAACVRLQQDGKILVAGRASAAGSSDMLVARLLADGSVDTSFATAGRLALDFDGQDDEAFALNFDGSGRLLIAGTANDGGMLSAAVARCDADGAPDAAFGDQGRATFKILGAVENHGRDVVAQAGGRIVLCGHASISNRDWFALYGFTSAGVADETFGTEGYQITAVGSGATIYSRAQSMVLLGDGKMVLAGSGTVSGSERAALARYSEEGLLDETFGTGGSVTTSAGSGETSARCVALLTDGGLLVGGTLQGATSRFVALRYLPSGALDTAFGASGIRLAAFTGYEADARALAVDANGLTLAGTLAGDVVSSIGLARLTLGGNLDNSFSGDGRQEINLQRGQPVSQARAVACQPDGKVVIAGSVATEEGFDVALLRRMPDGSADAGFGTAGRGILSLGPEDDFVWKMLLQTDGRILVGGTTFDNGTEKAFVARFNSDGTLDAGFGTGGVVKDQAGPADSGIYALALQPDGKIVGAGYAYNSGGTRFHFAAWRFTTAGALDTTFNSTGRHVSFVINNTNRDDFATAVAVQADGKILTAGTAYTLADQSTANFGMIRFQASGALDSGFGSGGKVNTPFSGLTSQARSVALQADGKIVVGGYVESGGVGGAASFASSRYLAGGTLDGSFGTGGQAVVSLGSPYDQSYDMVLDSEGRVLLAGTTFNGSTRIALLRLTTAGLPDPDFDGDGITAVSAGGDLLAYGMAFQSDGRLLIAGAAGAGAMAARLTIASDANTPPVAVDDTQFVLPGASVAVEVLANDSDADNDALEILSFTQPASGGVVSQLGNSLVFAAALNFTGASFTYTVSDGAGGTDTAAVFMTPVMTYAQWRVARFGAQANDPQIAGEDADPDFDGLDNLTEYALGRHPLQAETDAWATLDVAAGRLVLTYMRWMAAVDVEVTPEFCTDLTGWDAQGVVVEELGDDGIMKTLRATGPLPDLPGRQFGHLLITQ